MISIHDFIFTASFTVLSCKLGISLNIDKSLLSSYIRSRNMLDSPFSFYENIQLLPPGTYTYCSYVSDSKKLIKGYSSWDPKSISTLVRNSSFSADKDNFLSLPHLTLHPSISSSYVVSGGLDSSLVASTTFPNPKPNQNYITLTFGEKDRIANSAKDLISSKSHLEHFIKDVSTHEYTAALQESISLSLSPLSTHSVPSALILGKFASSVGSRVIYGGDGADEMHIGYPQYLDAFNSVNLNNNSPYGSYELDEEIYKFELTDLFHDADSYDEERKTLYSDYMSILINELRLSAKEASIKLLYCLMFVIICTPLVCWLMTL